MSPNALKKLASEFPSTPAMPVLFIGHGSPMNAIENNEYTEAWSRIAKDLPKPKAVLCISAHWFTDELSVHGAEHPRTIHDFYGFPEDLYAQRYACPGSPEGAKEVQRTAKGLEIGWDTEWGLDHGAWVPMKRLFPKADVPVFQLSIDYRRPSQFHYDLGKELASLRKKGFLVVASGNIVHNLGMMEPDADPFAWALEFDEKAKELIEGRDDKKLIAYETLGHAAHLSIPTPDHYWPLLYALGMRGKDERVSFFGEGMAFGSVSMRSMIFTV